MKLWNYEEKSELSNEESDFGSEVYMASNEFTRNSILICSTHGNIYAIHKSNGKRIWSKKFPSGAMGGVVSLFVTDDDKLIVGAHGKTACMNLLNGETIWINKMPGCGMEEVSILSTPSRILQPHKIPESHDSLDFPPNYNDQVIPDKPIILGCTRGKAVAMDMETGETLWNYNCPGGGYNIPSAIVEPPSLEEGRPNQLVYVGAGKWVYCLKARTGDVLWSAKVSATFFGQNYMTLATPWSSRLAAEAHTAFSQNPTAQVRSQARQKEQTTM